MEKRAVLFVDDDEAVLKDLEMSLRDEPYDKFFARSGEEAVEILQGQEVHVIVADMVMPRMDGLELLKIARKEHPHIVYVVLSGYAQASDVMTEMFEREIHTYIPKPWIFDEGFKAAVRRAADDYNLQSEHKDTPAESDPCPAGQLHAEQLHAE